MLHRSLPFILFLVLFSCGEPSTPSQAVSIRASGFPAQLTRSDDALVARRESPLRYTVAGWTASEPPPQLHLRASMPSMDHDAATVVLHPRQTDQGWEYRGTILFVMGGTWRMEMLDADGAVIGSHDTVVRERP